MSDTETEEPEQAVAHDDVPAALYAYGLSGEPLRMAPTDWQPIVAALRRANIGDDLGAAEVQPLLDAVFPDAGYQATDLTIDHPPTGTFTIADGDEPADRNFTSDDADLEMPDAQHTWDFGDHTRANGATVEHTFPGPGDYTVTHEVLVAGRVWADRQTVTVAGAPPVVTRIEPNSAVIGSDDFTLYVYGDKPFDDGTQIVWNEGIEPTTLVDGVATTTVRPSTATTGGTLPVGVETADGVRSNTVGFDFTGATTAPPGTPISQEGEEEEGEEEEGEDEEFDPSAHTVDEVVTYAEENPDDVDWLIGEEETGKARSTLLEKLYSMSANATT